MHCSRRRTSTTPTHTQHNHAHTVSAAPRCLVPSGPMLLDSRFSDCKVLFSCTQRRIHSQLGAWLPGAKGNITRPPTKRTTTHTRRGLTLRPSPSAAAPLGPMLLYSRFSSVKALFTCSRNIPSKQKYAVVSDVTGCNGRANRAPRAHNDHKPQPQTRSFEPRSFEHRFQGESDSQNKLARRHSAAHKNHQTRN